MHRDLYSSANVFTWNFWSNTFANNTNSGARIQLPDTYDLLSPQEHKFMVCLTLRIKCTIKIDCKKYSDDFTNILDDRKPF